MRVLLRAGLAGALTGALVLGVGVTGPATFAGIGLVSDAARGAAASLPGPRRLTAVALFLLLCVAWGTATDIVARRWAVR